MSSLVENDPGVTVLVLKSGARVRAAETLEYLSDAFSTLGARGLIEVGDPGDARTKLIPLDRIDYFEAEATA